MTAVAVRGPASRLPQGIVLERLGWPNDVVVTDPGTSYDVRLSAQAMAEIRAEVRRGARVRGPRIEIGGMLIGSVDDATGVVSVDIATGPSPDSKLSSGYFFHGMAGTDELVERYSHQSGRVIGFLGIWHSYPGGPARSSKMDMTGMSVLTTASADIPRALMVIVGGAPETWLGWVEGSGLPDIHVEMVARDPATLDETPAGPALQEVPFGEYLSGGYSVPPTHSRRRRRWVCWRRR
ncbi:Mov34/MPN/PAD-1 family protein [Umezawaea sp. NPDC059074]|uniref:Mov34/MPN/PAD-1 family protein n=1 Tax=Umezawaea sp. NPDC059074 TaxID=3346716 RepID=UPI00368ECDD7